MTSQSFVRDEGVHHAHLGCLDQLQTPEEMSFSECFFSLLAFHHADFSARHSRDQLPASESSRSSRRDDVRRSATISRVIPPTQTDSPTKSRTPRRG